MGSKVDFDHVEDVLPISPEMAITILDSIDCEILSVADRHLVELLSIREHMTKHTSRIYPTREKNKFPYYFRIDILLS